MKIARENFQANNYPLTNISGLNVSKSEHSECQKKEIQVDYF